MYVYNKQTEENTSQHMPVKIKTHPLSLLTKHLIPLLKLIQHLVLVWAGTWLGWD